jgi:hypothetical protein
MLNSGVVKSGVIIAAVMLVLSCGTVLLTPLCVPCIALLAGVGAGYLAGVFDKPGASGLAAQAGAGAGAIGGVGALLGHLIGGVTNSFIVGPEGAAQFLEQLGVTGVDLGDPTTYYISQIGGACCFGLVEVALMAGVGALGGMLWYQITGKNASAPPQPPMGMSS